MAQTLGLINVIWRGQKLSIEKGGTVKLGGLLQKKVITGQQVDYANEMTASEVNVTARVQRGTSIIALFAPGQGELQVECDTGQTYTWPDAFIADQPSFTAGDGGKLKVKWEAGAATEVLNG